MVRLWFRSSTEFSRNSLPKESEAVMCQKAKPFSKERKDNTKKKMEVSFQRNISKEFSKKSQPESEAVEQRKKR